MEDWTSLGQHTRHPEFPVVTQESSRNSRKTTWFPRHRKMKPFPATASQEKSHVMNWRSKRYLALLMRPHKVPRHPGRPWRGTLASGHKPNEVYWPWSHSRAIPSFPPQLEWKIALPWANTRGILNSPSYLEHPAATRESRRNSRKTPWFPRHRKMKPFPATASQEKSHVRNWRSKRYLAPLMRPHKVPRPPGLPGEEHRVFLAPLPLSPFDPPDLYRRVDSPAWSGRGSRPSGRTSG